MYHQPVLLKESIAGLNIDPKGIYVDATYGGGGHTKLIIEHLTEGKIIAFDQDKEAEDNVIQDDRLIFIRHNFKFMKNFLKYLGYTNIDGILADLGVSSHHLNKPERGFSYRFENAPLDMRMNQNTNLTAQYVINHYQAKQLHEIFRNYGEIRKTFPLVEAIINHRNNRKIQTTDELIKAIEPLLPSQTRNKFLSRVFQALRIEVNKEMDNLKFFLKQSMEMLKPGGRICVISYHSLEDKLVKNFLKTGNFEGEVKKDFYGNAYSPFKLINKKIITPGKEEIKNNRRARSARLRIAEKKEQNDER
ncbi:MAG: 16S rRNA (cytosine(1402)-N(4))-methyltransferase RsmH [Bacteroidales bacterium]